jgi:hypothetical protein
MVIAQEGSIGLMRVHGFIYRMSRSEPSRSVDKPPMHVKRHARASGLAQVDFLIAAIGGLQYNRPRGCENRYGARLVVFESLDPQGVSG